ncbi:2',3'-cyclic-nucleotide 3'-phosphodiesterase [Pseudochaenichthys georgianus]|uniref:2',3'-cyclic-nucleotide 3'-phosphodiesterase n=1 Tax=Pseudochaenichthys georgianus TaxID=52239 RepID=UPI00146A2FF3|nr:2',3'-cyclic-nucleotide 3'-phosphodiesterase isoform X1 [Pseudochaenichthys georgianus]
MDTGKSVEVLNASESPQQEDTDMEKGNVSKLETPEVPPAVEEETEQLAVNGHDKEVKNLTEELIVTENVVLSDEKTKMGDNLPTEKSEMESEASLVVERDESSEKISDPHAALHAEPENIQLLPENDPKPVPVQTPLAESAPKPEPEKLAESVPQEQTLPEPTALLPGVDKQSPSKEEEMSEQVGTETELQMTSTSGEEEVPEERVVEKDVLIEPTKEVAETVLVAGEKVAETVLVAGEKVAETVLVAGEKVAETVLVAEVASEKPTDAVPLAEAAEPTKVVEEEKSAETVLVAEVSSEKQTDVVPLKDEASAEVASVKPSEAEKEVEPEKSVESDTLKGAEAAAETSEKNDAEVQKEEDAVPASGSLSFALLERQKTKDSMRTSRTLVVLRGLPGSGKSFLARAIADAYKDHCTLITADDHGIKPENPESSVDGYKALDEAVVACCTAGTTSSVLIVVDDTNHTQDRLARMGELAEQHHLVTVFLEPLTEWSRDPAQLTKKTRRGLEEAQLETMRGPLEEMSLPLFFGWFLLSSVQDKVRCTSMDFLKTLDTLEAFKKHLSDFTGKAEKEVDLEQYFQAKGTLHCTTKFCDYGKAPGAKQYAENTAVKEFYGSAFELSLSALFVTPRTVGARVSLTEEQLLLWPADPEEEAGSTSLPRGSRAHITLGCAEHVEPVQTGLDLLEILTLQQEGQQGEPIEEMELGSLTYYGEGRWLLTLREPICTPACFSSFYGRKEVEPPKKEPEKKKKQKCTIL